MVVHSRIGRKRPEIQSDDVVCAFKSTLRTVARRDVDPTQWVGVGIDGHGRVLEYVAVETGVDEWLVFHCAPATDAVMVEVGLKPGRGRRPR